MTLLQLYEASKSALRAHLQSDEDPARYEELRRRLREREAEVSNLLEDQARGVTNQPWNAEHIAGLGEGVAYLLRRVSR